MKWQQTTFSRIAYQQVGTTNNKGLIAVGKPFYLTSIRLIFTLIISGLAPVLRAQTNPAQRVTDLLASTRQDTSMVWELKNLSNKYLEIRADTALLLAQRGLTIAHDLHYVKGEIEMMKKMAAAYATIGNFASSLESFLKALDMAKIMHDWEQIADCYHRIALLFKDMEEYQQSTSFFFKEKEALQNESSNESYVWNAIDIAENYAYLDQLDSTKFYLDKAYAYAVNFYKGQLPPDFLNNLGDLYYKMGKTKLALSSYHQSLNISGPVSNRDKCRSTLGIAKIYQNENKYDSAHIYALRSLSLSRHNKLYYNAWQGATFLSVLFKNLDNTDSAFYYQQMASNLTYQLFSRQKIKNFHGIYFSYQLKEQEIADRLAQSRQLFRLYIVIAILLFLAGLMLLVYHFKSREKNMRLQQALTLEQNQKEQRLLEFQNEKSALQMQVLRSQMNPHFIFNVLNSINHFILTHDTEVASDYLVKFSRLIRMVLSISQKNYVSLQEELNCLGLYVQMEQLRFEKYFQYTVHLEEDVKTEHIFIPPLLLQPFVENAIWHGLMHKKEGRGKLSIEIKQSKNILQCTITDNGIGRKLSASIKSKFASYKKSMGMQITANRLQMLDNKKNNEVYLKVIDITDAEGSPMGTQVILQIPVKIEEGVTV